jgi:SnoaL-like domain
MSIVKSSALGILFVATLAVVSVQAQELSPDDRAAIQDLSASYARTLAGCRAEEYADLFVPKTGYFASGFRGRMVILAAEKAAGLDAREMLAIQKLGGTKLGEYYEPDPNGVSRLLTSGVRIGVTDNEVTGRAFLKGGGYNDEVYEKLGAGKWRVTSSKYVPPEKK